MSNILQHHGILGMKWGVRRFQNQDGSWTSAGRSRYGKGGEPTKTSDSSKGSTGGHIKTGLASKDKVHKYLAKDTNADRKLKALSKEYYAKVDDYAAKNMPSEKEYFKDLVNYERTDKARKYEEGLGKMEDEYRKVNDKLLEDRRKEEQQLINDIFFNDEIKGDVQKARDTHNKLRNLENATIGTDSKYANQGYAEYLKRTKSKDNGDSEYGFFHYEWGPGNKYYDQANSEYKKQSKELESQYKKMTTDIGRKVVGDLADKKISNGWYETYAKEGAYKAKQIIENSYYWNKNK